MKYLIRDIRENCPDEFELFAKFVDKELMARLDFVLERPFQRDHHTRSGRASEKERREIRIPGRVRRESAIGARTLADRKTFQIAR